MPLVRAEGGLRYGGVAKVVLHHEPFPDEAADILGVHLLPDLLEPRMVEAGHTEESVGRKLEGGGGDVLELPYPLGVGLGILGVEGIDDDDRA